MEIKLSLKIPVMQIQGLKHNNHNLLRQKLLDLSKAEDNQKIKDIENEIGLYLKTTGKHNTILDYLFPEEVQLKKIEENIFSANSKMGSDKLCELPFIANHFINTEEQEGNDSDRHSAWANLMYDLGEFSIGEKHIEWLEKIIPYIYKLDEEWHVWWANILDAEGIVKNIWERLCGNDVKIVCIDDDEHFPEHFLGKFQETSLQGREKKECTVTEFNDGKLIWINPGNPFNNDLIKDNIEDKNEDTNIIKNIIEKTKKEKLLVFVVDLIFKGKKNANIIKGIEVIKHLREKYENILVVGLTGGTSPFIINSAEKAGADIVVFKKRGGDPENTYGHSSGGNAVGVFDLLWAISWNVTVWRLLKKFMEYNKEEKFSSSVKNITKLFFPNLETASPFWKKYLENWIVDYNSKKLQHFLKE